MAQLIIFINPDTFLSLVGEEEALEIAFAAEVGDDLVVLDGGLNCFFVFPDACHDRCVNAPFEDSLARDAQYIFVPDGLGAFDNFDPSSDFAVMHHQRTEDYYPQRFTRFRDVIRYPHCWGVQKYPEIMGSVYGQIAQDLANGTVDFQKHWRLVTAESITQSSENLLFQLRNGDFPQTLPRPFWMFADHFDVLCEQYDQIDDSNEIQRRLLAFEEAILNHVYFPPD